jgi:glycosyltransferase involved in cell wall biosynthesis
MLVSVIFPCFNPPEKWAENLIQEYKTLSGKIPEKIEFIVVVDGANDRIANSLNLLSSEIPFFKLLEYAANRGKGFAVRKGMEMAKGEILIYTDVDLPYTTESIFKIYSSLKNRECELAVGIKNDSYYKQVPFARRLLSKGLRKLIKFFLSIPITDTQCGLKGFVKEVRVIFLKTTIDRYLFDLEFIRLAYKFKYKIMPIQITLKENVHFRSMNYRILIPEMTNFMRLILKGQ